MVDVPELTIANIPLLETKLYPPQWRPGLVSRLRLLERIHKERKLTLVSAPAGFGKTTLLALLNELTAVEGGDIALILDDYHAIATSAIHK